MCDVGDSPRMCVWMRGCGEGRLHIVFFFLLLLNFFFLVYTFFILTFYRFTVYVLPVRCLPSTAHYPPPYIPIFFLPLPSTVYIPTLLQLHLSLFRTSIFPDSYPPITNCRPPTINYRPSTIAYHLYDSPSRIFTLLHSYTLLHFYIFFYVFTFLRFLHFKLWTFGSVYLWIFNSSTISYFLPLFPTPYSILEISLLPFFDSFNPPFSPIFQSPILSIPF